MRNNSVWANAQGHHVSFRVLCGTVTSSPYFLVPSAMFETALAFELSISDAGGSALISRETASASPMLRGFLQRFANVVAPLDFVPPARLRATKSSSDKSVFSEKFQCSGWWLTTTHSRSYFSSISVR